MTMFVKVQIPLIVSGIFTCNRNDWRDGIKKTRFCLHKTWNPTYLAMEGKEF